MGAEVPRRSFTKQPQLGLDGGHDAGPLFAHGRTRRAARTDNRGPARVKRVRQRMPAWVDRAKLRELYAEAKRLTRSTGEVYSVDHIVPLHNPLVSGLHWHGNLEIKLLDDNRRKSNLWWPDMPEEQPELLSL